MFWKPEQSVVINVCQMRLFFFKSIEMTDTKTTLQLYLFAKKQ